MTLRKVVTTQVLAVTVLAAMGAGDALASETRIEERLPDTSPQRKPLADDRALNAGEDKAPELAPFRLNGIEINGATAIDAGELAQKLANFVGNQVDANDMAAMAKALTDAYRDRGYFLSRAIIPPQNLADGRLRIRILEGQVIGASAEGMTQDDVNAQFATLLRERPARRDTLERALMLLSDRSGYSIDASQLLPVEGQPEQFRLRIKVSRQPISLNLFADNRGTGENGEDQVYGSISWNSLLRPSDQLTMGLFTSPSNVSDTRYAELIYGTTWLGGDLWTELGTSVTESSDPVPGATARSLSNATRLYATLSSPLIRTRTESLWAGITLDARDSNDEDGGSPPQREKLRVLRGSFSYQDVSPDSRVNIRLEASQGLDTLGASRNGTPNLSNDDTRPQFTRARLRAAYQTDLWGNLSMDVSAVGQYADGALPASEEFSFGGARYGRAYDYGTLQGDSGWATAIEFQYGFDAGFIGMEKMQIFAYADAGEIWNIGATPSGFINASAASAGGGLRFFILPGLSTSFEAAVPLSRDDAVNGLRTTRFFVSLNWNN